MENSMLSPREIKVAEREIMGALEGQERELRQVLKDAMYLAVRAVYRTVARGLVQGDRHFLKDDELPVPKSEKGARAVAYYERGEYSQALGLAKELFSEREYNEARYLAMKIGKAAEKRLSDESGERGGHAVYALAATVKGLLRP